MKCWYENDSFHHPNKTFKMYKSFYKKCKNKILRKWFWYFSFGEFWFLPKLVFFPLSEINSKLYQLKSISYDLHEWFSMKVSSVYLRVSEPTCSKATAEFTKSIKIGCFPSFHLDDCEQNIEMKIKMQNVFFQFKFIDDFSFSFFYVVVNKVEK